MTIDEINKKKKLIFKMIFFKNATTSNFLDLLDKQYKIENLFTKKLRDN